MNREQARKAADKLYARMIAQVVRAIGPFLGLPISSEVNKGISKATRPVIQKARSQVQNLAYQDYISVVGSDPVPKQVQNRFTEGLWDGVIEAQTKKSESVSLAVAESIGMQADRWTRDAEWGQRLDSAKKDSRVGTVARIDFEPPTCPWCTVLNSRGPVYHTLETGAATLHEGDTCTLVFVPKGSKTYPGQEHTAAALRRYKAATKAVGTKPTDVFRFLKEEDLGREIKPKVGKVRTNARNAAKETAQDEIKAIEARIRTLEKINPKSETATRYKEEQLSKNKDQLESLTRSLNS